MSPSRSPENFYATLDALLEAETGDLRELAKIAGVAPEKLYAGADLTGTDLTRQDIGFLLALDVKFEGARLLESQQRAFENARRVRKKRERIDSERVKLITGFVDQYRSIGPRILQGENRKPLDADFLTSIMLTPLLNLGTQFDRTRAKSAYLASVLIGLAPWASEENLDFFSNLFATMGVLGVAPSAKSLDSLSRSYLPAFGSRLGDLLSQLNANKEVDLWFVIDAASEDQRLLFASRLSSKRPLHPAAVMAVMQGLASLGDMITFLERTQIEVDDDTAEKIAFMLSRINWSQEDAEAVLRAKLPRAVFKALTRQIMEHPDQSRLSRLIEWRDADRGAAGGLSLDELFRAFKSFEIAIRTAESIAMNLGPSQIVAVTTALSGLASSRKEKDRLRRLLRSDTPLSGMREPRIPDRMLRDPEMMKRLL